MKRTKEEVKKYCEAKRELWRFAKERATTDNLKVAYEEALKTHTGQFSANSFAFVKTQMEELGLEGTPYIDTKTFRGWKDSGFTVKKGEKSKIDGMTWLKVDKESKEDEYVVPKIYKLFHRSQVEEIK